MKIKSVKYIGQYKLEVVFNDNTIIIADFEKFIKTDGNPMTSQFIDKDLFAQVKIDGTDLTWLDGQMDISGESILNMEFSV